MYRNKKVAAKAKIISRRAGEVNLNNLYGLIPPPTGRRQLFCPGWIEGRRVLRTKSEPNILIKNRFGLIFDPKYGPDRLKMTNLGTNILIFFFRKVRAQYIYFLDSLLIYWDHTF